MVDFTPAPFDGLTLPYFSPIVIPTLPLLSFSEDEKRLIALLQARQMRSRYWMELTDSYYRGMQVITDLGIAVPPELAGLRTLVGWPRIAVDPLVYRLRADGFRVPDATDVDTDIADMLAANRFGGEQTLAFKDALVKGRGFFTVGSSLEGEEFPTICVESPLNMSVLYDVRSLKPNSALQTYWVDGQRHAALYLPSQTIHMSQDDTTQGWEVTDRDEHNFGLVPVVRIANEPESDRRDGASEITPEIMSITDAACRTLLGLEVAREFYSVPQKYILGATESDFQNADGTPKTAWSTYVSHILALENDEEGNVKAVGQFQAYDPSVFVKVVEMYASQMAGLIGAVPQDLGLYTQGNPTTMDAYQAAEDRRNRYARHKQDIFTPALVDTVKMGLRFMHGGEVPDKYRHLGVDWMPPQMLDIAKETDAMVKQVSAGIVPAISDVVQKRLGYTPVERQQIEQDRDADQGASFLQDVAHSLTANAARTDKSLTADLAAPAKPAAPSPKDVFGGKQAS